MMVVAAASSTAARGAARSMSSSTTSAPTETHHQQDQHHQGSATGTSSGVGATLAGVQGPGQLYEAALASARACAWDEASGRFEALLAAHPGHTKGWISFAQVGGCMYVVGWAGGEGRRD